MCSSIRCGDKNFRNKGRYAFPCRKDGQKRVFPPCVARWPFLDGYLSGHATFPIWHQEADLWMLDLQNGNKLTCLDALNSCNVESYHSWSSNSRWVVFSSRRLDGLYTCPYIAYIDADGTIGKPFILPQARGDFYQECMNSFNIPEMVKGKVDVNRYQLVQKALDEQKEQVKSGI